jgi:amino acid transporter
MATASDVVGSGRHLRRDVGFWGLTFVSLGSIIGSGWLLGALTAASAAGPASLLTWILAAVILALLALVHAELGAAYPIAGGTARFPAFAFGPLAGFTAGWMGWLQAVAIAPIEVEATLSYMAHISWVESNVTILHDDGTLTGSGLIVASVFMLLFTVINLVGVKLLSETNSITVIWKTAIPILTIIVLLALTFHSGNFTAGGGFAPFGAHGVFAALPLGVVFAMQGFEQAIQLAGEAKSPGRDLPRAIMTAAAIGMLIYILLEITFIGSLNPANLVHGWANPVGKGDFGPYATLALAAGVGWLAALLYADAVVSPAGTGLIYLGTTARLSYALGRQKAVPSQVSKVSRTGVPLVSILIAFVIGELSFLPFPSWQKLVSIVTLATVIMYAFAPITLRALRIRDPERPRPYVLPFHTVLAPAAFVAANLFIYWSGFEAEWKLSIALVLGLIIFTVTRLTRPKNERGLLGFKPALWVWPWLVVTIIIGALGRYGGNNTIPEWWDILLVAVFSLIVYYVGVRLALSSEEVDAAVTAEQTEIETEPELKTA